MSSSSHNPRKQKLHHGSPSPPHHTPNPFSLLCLPFPIFMIRALPDAHLHQNPPNLPPSGKFPTSLPSLSRRFMGRHKRVSSGRHALRHYDHRFGEPWNGWKDWNKRKTLGKEEERKQKKQEFVGESSKFIAMDPASSRALFLPALYYTRKRDSIRF